MPSRHASLAARALAVLLVTLTALALVVPAAVADTKVSRVAGETRVDTSVSVAQRGWDQADHVLLATAVNYPDAIAAASLASALDGPVLLTMPDSLSPSVAAAIDELGATRVTLLGGTNALSSQVAQDAREQGVVVDRIAGDNRYETSAKIARRAAGLGDIKDVAIALGDREDGRDAWPDALSAASLTGGEQVVPTLLTARYELPAATRNALEDLSPDLAMVLGGPSAVGDEVTDEVAEVTDEVTRLRGPDRYDTSIRVAQRAMSSSDSQRAVFVSGEDFADALSGGALAAKLGAPLLLVPSRILDDQTNDYLRQDQTPLQRGLLIGGTAAVEKHVEKELVAAFNGEPRPAPPPPPCPENSSPDCRYTYRHDISTWERLAECESGGNWAINSGNGYYGGIQFSLSSWRSVGGSGYPHQNSKWEQMHRGEKLQARQGWGAWPACSRKLGLR